MTYTFVIVRSGIWLFPVGDWLFQKEGTFCGE